MANNLSSFTDALMEANHSARDAGKGDKKMAAKSKFTAKRGRGVAAKMAAKTRRKKKKSWADREDNEDGW